MSDVKMILVDVKNCETKVVTPSDYKDYYKLIGCELFDIVRRHIGDNGQKYNIICDDVGWFENSPIPSALNGDEIMFVGNILISGDVDFEGELISLTDDDIEYIGDHIKYLVDYKNGSLHPVVMDMKY